MGPCLPPGSASPLLTPVLAQPTEYSKLINICAALPVSPNTSVLWFLVAAPGGEYDPVAIRATGY